MLGVESEKRGSSSSTRVTSPYSFVEHERPFSAAVHVDKLSRCASVTIALPQSMFQQCGLLESVLTAPGGASDSAELPLDAGAVATWLGVALDEATSDTPLPADTRALYRIYQVR